MYKILVKLNIALRQVETIVRHIRVRALVVGKGYNKYFSKQWWRSARHITYPKIMVNCYRPILPAVVKHQVYFLSNGRKSISKNKCSSSPKFNNIVFVILRLYGMPNFCKNPQSVLCPSVKWHNSFQQLTSLEWEFLSDRSRRAPSTGGIDYRSTLCTLNGALGGSF